MLQTPVCPPPHNLGFSQIFRRFDLMVPLISDISQDITKMSSKDLLSSAIPPNQSWQNNTLVDETPRTEITYSEDLIILMKIVPILVPTLFSFIIFLGFIGNLLVVFVVLLNKNMRNTTNLLILNLAVSINNIYPNLHGNFFLPHSNTNSNSKLSCLCKFLTKIF